MSEYLESFKEMLKEEGLAYWVKYVGDLGPGIEQYIHRIGTHRWGIITKEVAEIMGSPYYEDFTETTLYLKLIIKKEEYRPVLEKVVEEYNKMVDGDHRPKFYMISEPAVISEKGRLSLTESEGKLSFSLEDEVGNLTIE